VVAEMASAAVWCRELGVLAGERKVARAGSEAEVRNHCSKQTRTVCTPRRHTGAGCWAPSASLCPSSTGRGSQRASDERAMRKAERVSAPLLHVLNSTWPREVGQ